MKYVSILTFDPAAALYLLNWCTILINFNYHFLPLRPNPIHMNTHLDNVPVDVLQGDLATIVGRIILADNRWPTRWEPATCAGHRSIATVALAILQNHFEAMPSSIDECLMGMAVFVFAPVLLLVCSDGTVT